MLTFVFRTLSLLEGVKVGEFGDSCLFKKLTINQILSFRIIQ